MSFRNIFVGLSFIASGVFAQPRISYIIPDIGAPGMAVYIEVIAPDTGSANRFSATDGLYLNNPGDSIRIECARSSDTDKISFGPFVTSWAGRLLSTIVFVSPTAFPNSPDWRNLRSEFRIPIRVRYSSTLSNIDTFYIVQPTILGDVRLLNETIFGAGNLGVRSRRGAMIVNDLQLKGATYTVSTTDPDNDLSNGDQSLLPFTLISLLRITGDGSTTKISVDANGTRGGPGGGGGGGRFCDNPFLVDGTDGGRGFTGGGSGGKNVGASSGYKSFGIGSGSGGGSVPGNSLNSTPGATRHAGYYEAAGGGTGHPFGDSGTDCEGGVSCSPAGAHGGASGQKDNNNGAGGGYATDGVNSPAVAQNGGKINGNTMVVPIAGGSGGSGANPRTISGCGGEGGGGGGALSIVAMTVNGLRLSANGADGSGPNGSASESGGAGSGGHIGVHVRVSQVQSLFMSAKSGDGAALSSGDGRIRLDGTMTLAANSTPAVGYHGPNFDTITVVSPPFTLRGTGEPGATIDIYMRSEKSNWQVVQTTTVFGNNAWTCAVPYSGPDNFLYIVAAQRVANPTSQNFLSIPTNVFSQTAAAVVQILRTAQLVWPSGRNIGSVSCTDKGTKVDTIYIKNTGNGDANLSDGAFQIATLGFSIESPLPLTSKVIKPNDSLRVVVRFKQQAGQYGVISDVLQLNFPGNTPPFITINYTATVDTVGLALVDVASGTIIQGSFSVLFERVCKDVSKADTFAFKNIGKQRVGITQFSLKNSNPVFTVALQKRSLLPGDTARFTIGVLSANAGVFRDTLVVIVDSCNIQYMIPIEAKVVATPVFGYSTAAEIFGPVKVGTSSAPHRLCIVNQGSDTDSADFRTLPVVNPPFSLTLIKPAALPVVLGKGDSIIFDIVYTPLVAAKPDTAIIVWNSVETSGSCPQSIIFKPNGFGTSTFLYTTKLIMNYGSIHSCHTKLDTVWVINAGLTPAKVYAPATLSGTDFQRFKIIKQPTADSTTIAGITDSLMYIIEFDPDPTDQSTSTKSAILSIRVFDDSMRALDVQLTAIQKKSKLILLNSVVLNTARVNNTSSVQAGIKNVGDTIMCITNVVSQHEPDVHPAFTSLQIQGDSSRALTFDVTPRSLADIFDTVTVYVGCPCIDSLKIPVIVHPTNNTLIINPQAVDFGNVKPCAKPTNITLSIHNVDTKSGANIDSVFIEGLNANSFVANLSWTTYPYVISANAADNSAISVGYNGGGQIAGLKTAQIIIRYTINGQTLTDTIPLRAVREVPLHADSTQMEFGSIKMGQIKTLPLVITNDHSQQLDISFGAGTTTLGAFKANPSLIQPQPSKSGTANIEFGKDSTGEYFDTLYVRYTSANLGCIDSVPIPLHGLILPGLDYHIWLDSVKTVNPTDKNVKIGIYAKLDTVTVSLPNLQFTASLNLPADMFIPRSVQARGARILSFDPIVSGRLGIKISVDTTLNTVSKDTTLLAYLAGDAMLGSKSCDSMTITAFDWTNSGLRPTTWENQGKGNGLFCTTVCSANGQRLLGGALTGLTFKISPHPADEGAVMTMSTVESGHYNVSLVNSTGQIVLNFSFEAQAASSYEFNNSLKALSNGVYYVHYASPTNLLVAPLLILK